MTQQFSQMRRETLEIPESVERLLTLGADTTKRLAELVREKDPRFLISIARGSSDHACTFIKYVAELTLQIPTASVGPSIHSIYKTKLTAKDALCLAVSQSGQSPDIVGMTGSLRASGALTYAITNDSTSRLASIADAALPFHAGPELSVAATKTFIASLVAGLWLIATIKDDTTLLAAIHALPRQLDAAINCDWSAAASKIDGGSVFTLGRGPTLAISNEAALKFKETCLIHAESYSSAEVQHGPMSIVSSGFPVVIFAAQDAAEASLAEAASALVAKGANVFITSSQASEATALPHARTGHPLTDPIATIVSFYVMVEALARSRLIDPDHPRHLSKVTQTL
ncbi:MAG: SIS domain-containing protein [Pseudomonadota bacterium]